ncbi:MAG: dTMP kinase [Candidatus Pacearchaeota archaeon]|nr:dTMP kinase [Candidatus Pacearchaeota archaeon]
MKGKLITFEGVDGCGKTTVLNKVFEFFNKKYPNRFLKARDPGTTEIGEKIRKLLLYKNMNKWTEFNLFLAARAQLVNEFLIPNIKKGKIVLLDRFYDSTIAYQGFRNGVPLEMIVDYNKKIKVIEPDLTLLFDLPLEEAQKRILSDKRNLTVFDKENIEQHKKVHKGYKWIAKKYKKRVNVIDASRSIEEVTKDAIKIISKHLRNVVKN